MTDNEADTNGGQWLSHPDSAEIRGADRAAVLYIARRKGWPRQDGHEDNPRVAAPYRVLVARSLPHTAPMPSHEACAAETSGARDSSGPMTDFEQHSLATIHALSTQMATLRDQLTVAQATAMEREEQLRQEMEAATTRLQATQTQLASARLKASAFKAALHAEPKQFWRRWLG